MNRKADFFLQNESIRIDSNRELECSSTRWMWPRLSVSRMSWLHELGAGGDDERRGDSLHRVGGNTQLPTALRNYLYLYSDRRTRLRRCDDDSGDNDSALSSSSSSRHSVRVVAQMRRVHVYWRCIQMTITPRCASAVPTMLQQLHGCCCCSCSCYSSLLRDVRPSLSQ